MGRAQELFDKAVVSYDSCIKMIRTMDETFQRVAFKDNPSARYDTRVTLAQFDMILQAVLLTMAMSDGNFDRLEQQFVEKITDYGDLLTFIRKDSNGQIDLTWSQVAALSPNTQRKLVDALPAILNKLCDSFVKPLAIVDSAINQVDFLDKLETEIAAICVCLSFVDGDSDQGEANACAQMVAKLLSSRWRNYMN